MTSNSPTPKECPQCKKKCYIFHKDLCLRCVEAKNTELRYEVLRKAEGLKSEYNHYLLELLLDYLEQCVPRAGYATQAEAFCEILRQEAISPITSWVDIDDLTDRFPIFDRPNLQKGSAFKKIGRMLQQLGVLGHSEVVGGHEREFHRLNPKVAVSNRKWVTRYFQASQKRKITLRTQCVILGNVLHLQCWLQEKAQNSDLSLLNLLLFDNYLKELKGTITGNQFYCRYKNLAKFYRYGLSHRFCLQNPFECITIRKPRRQLRRLSDKKIRQLFKFISDPTSDPEFALLIGLVLCYGLKGEDIAGCEALFNGSDKLSGASFPDKKISAGTRRKKRSNLSFQSSPKWFRQLVLRYQVVWNRNYSLQKKMFGSKPLFLPGNHWNAVRLNSRVLSRKLAEATSAALDGESVNFTLLRNTCAYIHTHNDDASALEKLGWTNKSSFEIAFMDQKIL